MRPLAAAVRRLGLLIVAVAAWLGSAAVVWAADEAEKPSKGGTGQWLMCYAVVFLFLVLGLMLLLRPSGRRDRPKMEQ